MIRLFQRSPRLRDLRTSRLRLVAMTPAMLSADLARDGSLGALLAVTLTPEWPPRDWEPHVVRMTLAQAAEKPQTVGWHRYVMLTGKPVAPQLIGCVGGFAKPEGAVEIGYSVLPSFQRRGFATEAVDALIRWLMRDERVSSITAQATTDGEGSIKVMERCGLRRVGAGDDLNTVRYTLARP